MVHEREIGRGRDEEPGECAAAGGVERLGQVPVRNVVEAVCGVDSLHRGDSQPSDKQDAGLQGSISKVVRGALNLWQGRHARVVAHGPDGQW